MSDDDVRRHVVVRVAAEVVVDLMGRACRLDYAEVAPDAVPWTGPTGSSSSA